MTDSLNEDLCAVVIVSRSVLLKMRNVPEKRGIQNQNTFLYSITFFRNRGVGTLIVTTIYL